jgi:hypothetical protein
MNISPLHRALVLTAWIAGVFCLLVGAVMVYEHFAAATNDPWKSPQLLALKEKLAAEPKNESLQTRDSPTRLEISPEVPPSARVGQNRRLAAAGRRDGRFGAGGQPSGGSEETASAAATKTDAANRPSNWPRARVGPWLGWVWWWQDRC